MSSLSSCTQTLYKIYLFKKQYLNKIMNLLCPLNHSSPAKPYIDRFWFLCLKNSGIESPSESTLNSVKSYGIVVSIDTTLSKPYARGKIFSISDILVNWR